MADDSDRRRWQRLPGATSIGDGAATDDKENAGGRLVASQSTEPPVLPGAALRRAVGDQIFWYVRTIFPRAARKTDTLLTLHELGGCFGAGALASPATQRPSLRPDRKLDAVVGIIKTMSGAADETELGTER
jgi:hypothetical protein